MNIVAAILTCSLYTDDALVRAIVDNAHDNPLAIFTRELDPTTGASSDTPETLEAAVAQLRASAAHGGRPLVGLMQIPVTWAQAFNREPADLFDPCINVSIGTAMLSEFDYACAKVATTAAAQGKGRGRARVPHTDCVARAYAQAIGIPELRTVIALGMHYRPAALATPTDAPIFAPTPGQQAWGSVCVFIGASSVPREGEIDRGRDSLALPQRDDPQ